MRPSSRSSHFDLLGILVESENFSLLIKEKTGAEKFEDAFVSIVRGESK